MQKQKMMEDKVNFKTQWKKDKKADNMKQNI